MVQKASRSFNIYRDKHEFFSKRIEAISLAAMTEFTIAPSNTTIEDAPRQRVPG